jgi:hypothetical protein
LLRYARKGWDFWYLKTRETYPSSLKPYIRSVMCFYPSSRRRMSISIKMNAALMVGKMRLIAYYRGLPFSSVSFWSVRMALKHTPYEPEKSVSLKMETYLYRFHV